MLGNRLVVASAMLFLLNACSENGDVENEAGEYELENKHEYSILESEYYLRESEVVDRNFITVSKFDPEYEIAIIKADDSQYKFSVLLLNPRHPPLIKSFPIKDVEVPPEIKARIRFRSN